MSVFYGSCSDYRCRHYVSFWSLNHDMYIRIYFCWIGLLWMTWIVEGLQNTVSDDVIDRCCTYVALIPCRGWLCRRRGKDQRESGRAGECWRPGDTPSHVTWPSGAPRRAVCKLRREERSVCSYQNDIVCHLNPLLFQSSPAVPIAVKDFSLNNKFKYIEEYLFQN